jgi:hypothetical protein
MIKRHGIFFGVIVILITVMFTLAGCDNGTTSTGVNDFPDTYTHASHQYAIAALPGTGAVLSKTILTGTEYDAAVQFIHDHSHYLYVERNTRGAGPFIHPFYTLEPYASEPWAGRTWVSAITGYEYVAPAGDPRCREVKVLSINPNGSITASHGSYWGLALGGQDLSDLDITNAYGWKYSDKPQPFIYFSHGQTTQNLIDRHRGTMAIDARGSELPAYDIDRARYFFVEVKLRSYDQRRWGAKGLFDGMYPGGNAMSLRELMTQDAETLLTAAEYWGVATNIDPNLAAWFGLASNNLLTDEARAAYIAELEANTAVQKVFQSYGPDYLWFDIMQITKVSEDLGWTFSDIPGY